MEVAERAGSSAGASTSRAAPAVVPMRREALPMDLLVAKEDSSKLPRGVVQTKEQLRDVRHDVHWASKREHIFAAVAAGMHLAGFMFNLAFWGVEGMPPDRYWPSSPRIRLRIRPGRYGNVEGTQRVYMDYLARSEGVGGALP